MSQGEMKNTATTQLTSADSKASQIEQAEANARTNQDAGTKMLQQAVQNVSPQEAASVYRQVAQYDQQAHQKSLVEMSQGHLTISSAFSESASQGQTGFLSSLETKGEGLFTNQEDMWNRVLAGNGSVTDDAIAGLEVTAAASLAVAGGAALAGVAGLEGLGSFGILGYSPLTAGLNAGPLMPFSMSMIG